MNVLGDAFGAAIVAHLSRKELAATGGLRRLVKAFVRNYQGDVEQLEAAVATDSRFVAAWAHLARVELLRNNQSGFETAVEQLRRLDPRLAQDFEPSP